MTVSDADVLVRRQGRIGRITLQRPKAINALTLGMLQSVAGALDAWDGDADIRAVLIDGAGERGFCAGADLRALADSIRTGDPGAADRFMAFEYRLNARIAHYPKPYVALMDGVVMGGGVGLSAHGSVRIVTERTRLAMPEVGIGLLADVGGTYLLSRTPGELGTHLALTGESIEAADAMLCGLADRHVAADRLPALIDALTACDDAAAIEACVADHASPPAPGRLAASADWILACHGADDVPAILAALRNHPDAGAQAAARRIAGNCPTSLAVTLRALRDGRRLGRLEPCLEQEYRLVTGLMRRPDFLEGIRAAIIDKDRTPSWQPAGPYSFPAVVPGLFD
ncbi:enoyl-CoA hydratase/isomerase family protein [Lichenicola sp.]|uniref:enoyl-CoA hydratase/isomerase family protein n=1 Tax=Lichenicola sp. TaxID=2804529 RepID=UPI003AFFC524